MNPLPAPKIPGNTEFERFDNAMRKVLSVKREQIANQEKKPLRRGKYPKKK
jgi:hypothetical protein